MNNKEVEKRIKILADYLEISADNIEFDGDEDNPDYKYEQFYTENGSYYIMTEEEADEAHLEYIENFVEEMGIEGFSLEFQEEIEEEYLNQDIFEEICNEYYYTYAADIESETYQTTYINRLIDECVDMGIISEDDLDEDGDYKGSIDLVEEISDRLVESVEEDYDGNYAKWLVDQVGHEELRIIINKNPNILDTEAISEACIRYDGYGNNLASWDCRTIEYDDYYLFKQDEYDNRSDEFKTAIKTKNE